MAFIHLLCLIVFLSNVSSLMPITATQSAGSNLQTYIVHLTPPDNHNLSQLEDLESYYHSFLPTSSSASENQRRLLYSYRYVMTGFAARLTPDEVAAMHNNPGFVAAHLDQIYRLQTTRSPKFLGLPLPHESFLGSTTGKGIIIGVLDTGISPDHPSFRGDGMPPPPAKWKGRCDFNPSQCNHKLIGARTFDSSAKNIMPPFDDDGHGTHTASTAAGASVQGANTLGMARGTARGMAPYAHLAIYKVCSKRGCPLHDIFAGIDAALADGVDIISISIGRSSTPRFYEDDIPKASFAAMQRGVFVSCSAGNSGPFFGSVTNGAPWILTVGASTIDRNIVSEVKLGNGVVYEGETVYQPHFPSILLPLVYGVSCFPGGLKGSHVKGKIVLCERQLSVLSSDQAKEVERAGGAAMILMNQQEYGFSSFAEVFDLPASHVSYLAGTRIKKYIRETRSPTATIIFKGTVLGNLTAPTLAAFSSRGPSLASPGILKPDITGPGVNILAAWPPAISPGVNFNILSGTSMSCPHLSGIAALIKGVHLDWSPAAIKSAIVTSAKQLSNDGKPIQDERLQRANFFAIGAGHVVPRKAIDPGLVYDIQPDDYIPYLCGLQYTDEQVSQITHKSVKCSRLPRIPEGQLNYPSFSVILGPRQRFTRTVTNVGTDYSPYLVRVVKPPGVIVTVEPRRLKFSKLNEKASYTITFSRISSTNSTHNVANLAEGYLRWDSNKYSVRSPILVRFH